MVASCASDAAVCVITAAAIVAVIITAAAVITAAAWIRFIAHAPDGRWVERGSRVLLII